MPEPHLRAADSDRAAVATALGQAMAEGRLTVAEYDERLSSVHAARTYGELAGLTADLPRAAAPPAPRPTAPPAARAVPACAAGWHGRAAWASWSSTALVVLTIWAVVSLASGELRYFWPMWVIGPWGAVLVARTLARAGRGPGEGRRPLTG